MKELDAIDALGGIGGVSGGGGGVCGEDVGDYVGPLIGEGQIEVLQPIGVAGDGTPDDGNDVAGEVYGLDDRGRDGHGVDDDESQHRDPGKPKPDGPDCAAPGVIQRRYA